MSDKDRQIFLECLERMLRPLAYFCLQRSIKFQDFVDVAKSAFLGAAREEIEKIGVADSVSRLSVMTGLQRRDVARLGSTSAESKVTERQNLIARLIGQWVSDKNFVTKQGKPRILSTDGRSSEFAKLARTVSKDLNFHTVLFELERLGIIKREPGKATLVHSAYEVKGNLREGFSILAEDTQDLIAAATENISAEKDPPNLHAKTYYDNICEEFLPEIRDWLLKFGQRIHQEAREFLSKFDKDINPAIPSKRSGARVAIGTYSHIRCEVEHQIGDGQTSTKQEKS